MEKWLEMLELPKEIREEILQIDYQEIEEEIQGLLSTKTSENARAILKRNLKPDECGLKMLGCMLHCLKSVQEKYQEKGISEEVFVETMKCFSRFVNEHKVSYGHYGFDRDWWTSKQLSMNLFRIGELEYEFYSHESEECIGLHIPSDAVLTEENCRQSLMDAKAFFKEFYPEALQRKIYCHSWLLSPALESLLPSNSNILKFQKSFEILNWEKGNDSFFEWVFKGKDIPLSELPENTSLQKNIKRHLLQGGKIGAALGVTNWQ